MFDPDKLLQQRRLQTVTANVKAQIRETERMEQVLAEKLGMSLEQFKVRCKKESAKGKTKRPEVKKLVSKVLGDSADETSQVKPRKLPRHTQYI